MLHRFSLYGFLKNQQYYDPFLILAFREKGLSFLQIGMLIAFREVMVNVLEIPSGAMADVYGRRKSMILSFMAYIVSFSVFGFFKNLPFLFLGMLFFAIGDAFRTGTHKAMIFTWLRIHGRVSERTKVYGYTRSWSKFGSAVSVIVATILVFISNSYVYIFYLSIIPYLLGIVNVLGYPKELDGDPQENVTLVRVALHMKEVLCVSFSQASLRRLIMESMGFEGVFKAAKDYLQPVLQSAALPLTSLIIVTSGLDKPQKTALLVGPIYFMLHVLSGIASRNAHRIVDSIGGETHTVKMLWGLNFMTFTALVPAMWYRVHLAIVAGFIILFTLQNLWRPLHISRFDSHSSETQGATVLSIESQAKSVSTMIAAPVLGWAVDLINVSGSQQEIFWPVGIMGAAVALIFFFSAGKNRPAINPQ